MAVSTHALEGGFLAAHPTNRARRKTGGVFTVKWFSYSWSPIFSLKLFLNVLTPMASSKWLHILL